MTRVIWDRALNATRQAHSAVQALSNFCLFPNDLTPQEVQRYPIPSAELLAHETGLADTKMPELRDAFIAAGPSAKWRETYKGTPVGNDFLDRFGCFCLIGAGGAYQSTKVWAWTVYMPANLHYPWHHHPGEEIYLVIAGQAEFHRHGQAPVVLASGETSFHRSNQPHAMETFGHPVMALVLWRNGFATSPILTPPDAMK